MAEILVRHERDDRFAIDVRGHQIFVDQPIADGGSDTAPTPTELLVAALASCVGFYARRYLARHDLPVEGLTVSASYTMASQPARVGHIDVNIALPQGVPDERRAALLAVASHCTVHNTLVDGPMVRVALAQDAVAA
jgi:putative redox protein